MKIVGIGTELYVGRVVSILLDKVVVTNDGKKQTYAFADIKKLFEEGTLLKSEQ